MKPKLLLKLAIVCLAIHLMGHAYGHFTWKDSQDNPEQTEVIRQMTDHKFDFMGTNRSMADYYEGFSALILIKYLVLILILWATSEFVKQQPHLARKILAPTALGLVAFGILEFVYFFPFAASMSILAGVAVFLSMFGKTND